MDQFSPRLDLSYIEKDGPLQNERMDLSYIEKDGPPFGRSSFHFGKSQHEIMKPQRQFLELPLFFYALIAPFKQA